MKNVFGPAVGLMARLKYPQRFGLITVLFLLPLGIALFMLMSRIDRDINFAQHEMQGTAYLRPTNLLFRHAMSDWILSQQALRGLDVNNDALKANQSNIDNDFAALSSVDSQYGASLGTTAAFTKLKSDWDAMRALPQDINRQILYKPFIDSIHDLISQVGDRSTLILDSSLDTHYAMQTLVVDLPFTQQSITNLAVLGDQVLGLHVLEGQDKADLQVLGNSVLEGDILLRRDADVAYANNSSGTLKSAIEGTVANSISASDALVSMLTDQILSPPQLLLPLDTWRAASLKALDATSQQWDTEVGQLDDLLQTRNADAGSTRNLALLIAATVLLIVAYMWVGFYLAIMRTVTGLEEASRMLATGTISSVNFGNNDELSQRTAQAINNMASTTSTLNTAMNARTTELTEVALLFAHMHDGMVITDANGVIKVLNGAASRMLGVKYEDAVNHPLVVLAHQPRLQDTITSALSNPAQHYMVDIALNNRIISTTTTFAPMADGSVTGLFVLQDVTELRTLQALQQQSGRFVPVAAR